MINRILMKALTSLLMIFLIACTTAKQRYPGRIAKPDQIQRLESKLKSDVWYGKELTIEYSYTTVSNAILNMKGNIILLDTLKNSYPKIYRLNLHVSFLDNNNKIVTTSTISPLFSVGSHPPKQIPFSSEFPIPPEAAAFCFSYSGKFKGDDKLGEFRLINQTPFNRRL